MPSLRTSLAPRSVLLVALATLVSASCASRGLTQRSPAFTRDRAPSPLMAVDVVQCTAVDSGIVPNLQALYHAKVPKPVSPGRPLEQMLCASLRKGELSASPDKEWVVAPALTTAVQQAARRTGARSVFFPIVEQPSICQTESAPAGAPSGKRCPNGPNVDVSGLLFSGDGELLWTSMETGNVDERGTVDSAFTSILTHLPADLRATTGDEQEAATAPTTAPLPKPAEADVHRALSAREGETPAETTPIPGAKPLDDQELQALARCAEAREKPGPKSRKPASGKQGPRPSATERRCAELAARREAQTQGEQRDAAARAEMRRIANALSKSPSCGSGEMNPALSSGAPNICAMYGSPLIWDRQGWSCVARSLEPGDKEALATPRYAYSFRVDLRTTSYELVGQGCAVLPTEGASPTKTELVLRGRFGDGASGGTPVYRRPPRDP